MCSLQFSTLTDVVCSLLLAKGGMTMNKTKHRPATKITFIDAFLDQNLFGWPTMEELLEAIADLGLTLLRTCS